MVITITRIGLSPIDVAAWKEGEGEELKRWIGFGFYKTKFIYNESSTIINYDEKECEVFGEVLDEKLTEELFNNICDRFFELIEESKSVNTNNEIYKIMVKCWPMWTIFDELSKYPEYGNDNMIRRLIRVRKETESFSYELSSRIKN